MWLRYIPCVVELYFIRGLLLFRMRLIYISYVVDLYIRMWLIHISYVVEFYSVCG